MKWSDWSAFCASLCLVLASIIKEGACLSCFRCYSLDSSVPDCDDDFGSFHLKGHLLDRDCKVGVLEFESFYCIKIKGTKTDTGEQVVIRTCSSINWGTQCGGLLLEQANGDELSPEPIDGCVASCTFDGCNRSGRLKAYPVTLLFGITLCGILSYLLRR